MLGTNWSVISRYRLRVAAMAVLLSLNVLLPGVVQADTEAWSPAVAISGGMAGWFPTIAADNSGNVYVVWNGGFADRPLWTAPGADFTAASSDSNQMTRQVGALYFTRWDGRSWSTPNDIALASWTVALRSALAVDSSGWLHLVRLGISRPDLDSSGLRQLIGTQDVWYTSAYGMQAESTHAWQTPTRLTHSSQGYFSDMAIDAKGVIHVIWTESARGAWGLYYTHSMDGGMTWSPRVPLDEDNPVWWYRARLVVDDKERVHVVWEILDRQGRYGHIRAMAYALSKDGGLTWSETVFPGSHEPEPYSAAASQDFERDGAPPGPQQPTVGVDGQGTILLVYREPGHESVVYRQSLDGTNWSAPAPLPGVTAGVPRPYDVYSMATDSAGHVHLVMVGYPAGSPTMSLLHSEWNGKDWMSPQVITQSPLYPEYPRIAIGEGNRLHVTWFDGDRGTVDRTPTGVFYSTAYTNAPRLSQRATLVGISHRRIMPPRGAQERSAPMATVQSTSTQPLRLPPSLERTDRSGSWLSTVEQNQDFPLIVALMTLIPLFVGVFFIRFGLRR